MSNRPAKPRELETTNRVEDVGRADAGRADGPPERAGESTADAGDNPTAALPGIEARSIIAAIGQDATGVHLKALGDEPVFTHLPRGPDRYQMIRLLGEGGMGMVFLAHDRDVKRRIAVKMLKETGSTLHRRFLEESQILGQLEHPNIVAMHDLGLAEGGRMYYIMRWVRGQTLTQVFQALRAGERRARETWSLTRLVQVFLQVSQALGYAHDKGVIHRDLKPGNIMLGEHGEVQVVDWGLAQVVGDSDVETMGGKPVVGELAGTPSHMPPEQVRGAPLDARADVYALGVLLYEILTWSVPFRGSMSAVLQAQIHEPPEPPRKRAPDRAIPAALERICLGALEKLPALRPADASTLHDEVQAWLEGEADRARRHEQAEERARAGGIKLEEYRRGMVELNGLKLEAERLARSFDRWQSVEEKAAVFAAEDRATGARDRLERTGSELVATLSEALGFEKENRLARELLSDYYWERFQESESAGDRSASAFFGDLVALYHDGKRARELEGTGSLALDSDPPGAEAWLYRLREERLELRPREERRLGITPLGALPLAMGRWLVVLKKKGFRDTTYPVHISRNRDWTGTVRLFADQEIGEEYAYVPGGPFLAGGDPAAEGWSLARGEPDLPGFFIGIHPVTVSEWLEFARASGTRAERIAELESANPRLPVVNVSWNDAVAYCAWLSVREGREIRLPSEQEWEKAARGVDGRWFPWGDRFDASLCNMVDSLPRRPELQPVDAFPSDVSIYGVRGLAGNVRDWTATEMPDPREDAALGARVIRGGAWNLPANISRSANRFWLAPSFTLAYTGFRLCRTAPR